MEHNNQQISNDHSIQACVKDGEIKLTLGSNQEFAVQLSTQQARALACDLIQHVHRADINRNLKKIKTSGQRLHGVREENRL